MYREIQFSEWIEEVKHVSDHSAVVTAEGRNFLFYRTPEKSRMIEFAEGRGAAAIEIAELDGAVDMDAVRKSMSYA